MWRWYTVYKYRLQLCSPWAPLQMYGDPVVSVVARSQREAVAWVRANIGPGAWSASPTPTPREEPLP